MSARVMFRLPSAVAPTDDRALVARFAAERDESAFAALVKRHGAMVYGVCRRAVRDDHHAEDAFQATFLVLAKNPSAAANAASVGAWLFGVARRVGLSAARRLRRATQTTGGLTPRRPPDPDFDELLAVLDEEVASLPEDCRAAVVACFLREQTQDEAARQLGWSLSTLRRRLERGKELLRARLTRRGATLSALLLTNALAKANTPATLLDATLDTCLSDSAPPTVAALAAVRPPVAWKLIACAAVVLGAVAFAAQPPDPPPTPAPAPRVVEPRPWVTLVGQVVLPDRVVPPIPRGIPREEMKDAEHCLKNGPVFEENILVNPTNLGIRNVVVWLRPDSDDPKAVFPKDKIHPSLAAPKPRDREVVVTCCQFEPRITVARAGDTMVYKNTSVVHHNVNYTQGVGDANPNYNVLLAPDKEYRAERPLTATRIGNPFQCNIHPWMRGYAWAFDHPYFAVTDENGRFAIPSVPVGTWRIVMWHEKVGYRDGRAGRLGHKITVADGVTGIYELPRTPHTSDGWGQE